MRTGLGSWLKGATAETIMKIVANKVDMFKEGKRIDEIGDNALPEKSSERIQRGSITIGLTQFIRGMWDESPSALVAYYRQEADTIEKQQLLKGEKK